MFLPYILLERILDGEPTIFQNTAESVYSVTGANQSDIKVYPRDGTLPSPPPAGVLALVDSNSTVATPYNALIEHGYFIVQASSPEPRRWKSWAKEVNARVRAMGPWSWEETFIGA
jgi:hypothetical protein